MNPRTGDAGYKLIAHWQDSDRDGQSVVVQDVLPDTSPPTGIKTASRPSGGPTTLVRAPERHSIGDEIRRRIVHPCLGITFDMAPSLAGLSGDCTTIQVVVHTPLVLSLLSSYLPSDQGVWVRLESVRDGQVWG